MNSDDFFENFTQLGIALWVVGIILLYVFGGVFSLIVELCFLIYCVVVLTGKVPSSHIENNKYVRGCWWLITIVLINPIILRLLVFLDNFAKSPGAENTIFLFMSFFGSLLGISLLLPFVVFPVLFFLAGKSSSETKGRVFTFAISMLSTCYILSCFFMTGG